MMEFYNHLLTFLSEDEANMLCESLKSSPKSSLRVNSLKCEQILDLLPNVSLLPHKHVKNAYMYDKEQDRLGKDILFDAGAYYIQEPAAMLAVSLLEVKPHDKVLDMCSAPGGKAFDALIDMEDTGLLVCNDIHQIRSRVLSSNIEKYGFKQTIVLNDDSSNYKKYFTNYFDKIILDAPCSGSGMFRKDIKAKQEWSMEKVQSCALIQKSLIEDAYEMLNDQGVLLYSTCSFSIQENEDIIIEFLNNHKDMSLIPIKLNKQYNDSINISGGIRLYPFKYDGEGQVIFILKKNNPNANFNLRIDEIRAGKIDKNVLSFLDAIKLDYDKNNIVNFNNHYYLADFDKFSLKGVKFLRYGLELGELVNGRFIPSHALAKYQKVDKSLFIELDEYEALSYLKGMTINKEGNRGYLIATYKNIALGFVKQSNNILKNHYPKGLRRDF